MCLEVDSHVTAQYQSVGEVSGTDERVSSYNSICVSLCLMFENAVRFNYSDLFNCFPALFYLVLTTFTV